MDRWIAYGLAVPIIATIGVDFQMLSEELLAKLDSDGDGMSEQSRWIADLTDICGSVLILASGACLVWWLGRALMRL